VLTALVAGDYFGDFQLLFGTASEVAVRAVSFTEVAILSYSSFQHALDLVEEMDNLIDEEEEEEEEEGSEEDEEEVEVEVEVRNEVFSPTLELPFDGKNIDLFDEKSNRHIANAEVDEFTYRSRLSINENFDTKEDEEIFFRAEDEPCSLQRSYDFNNCSFCALSENKNDFEATFNSLTSTAEIFAACDSLVPTDLNCTNSFPSASTTTVPAAVPASSTGELATLPSSSVEETASYGITAVRLDSDPVSVPGGTDHRFAMSLPLSLIKIPDALGISPIGIIDLQSSSSTLTSADAAGAGEITYTSEYPKSEKLKAPSQEDTPGRLLGTSPTTQCGEYQYDSTCRLNTQMHRQAHNPSQSIPQSQSASGMLMTLSVSEQAAVHATIAGTVL